MIDVLRRRKVVATAAAKIDTEPVAGDGLVRISMTSLLALRHGSATLALQPRRVRALTSGAYLSSFKGRGMEFDEVRPYTQGDDVRSIDWRVTARSGKPHTKLFREERERAVLLWVDLRAAMFFATRGAFKALPGQGFILIHHFIRLHFQKCRLDYTGDCLRMQPYAKPEPCRGLLSIQKQAQDTPEPVSFPQKVSSKGTNPMPEVGLPSPPVVRTVVTRRKSL